MVHQLGNVGFKGSDDARTPSPPIMDQHSHRFHHIVVTEILQINGNFVPERIAMIFNNFGCVHDFPSFRLGLVVDAQSSQFEIGVNYAKAQPTGFYVFDAQSPDLKLKRPVWGHNWNGVSAGLRKESFRGFRVLRMLTLQLIYGYFNSGNFRVIITTLVCYNCNNSRLP
eukprot:CAMPEP_0183314264 /NCGR_PEP_ID=MMETSP0160_2-20130417/47924_1 /TAXON_ID=2839 ORGANISM="Odontella Sinensis, Strain Grunow 1884" /NCGR_SAMPLE_ID=MMETSP0160_2 /ASSEMBLY_ACC=CAM_ASM_000250 /LENGTH=168 /DNA_ID=CAMNT_0025479549 /DNA_START=274 /DNA_END=776 /DNA_ORIENTATION=+